MYKNQVKERFKFGYRDTEVTSCSCNSARSVLLTPACKKLDFVQAGVNKINVVFYTKVWLFQILMFARNSHSEKLRWKVNDLPQQSGRSRRRTQKMDRMQEI